MNNREYKRRASRDIGIGGPKCPCCADRNSVRRGHRRVRHLSKATLTALATPKTPIVRAMCEREGIPFVEIEWTNTPDELMDMVVEDLAKDADIANQAIDDQIDAQIKGVLRGGK